MKNKIKTFAIWLLEHTDKAELKRMKVDYDLFIGLDKYLPKKNKWYHVAASFETFIKRFDKNERVFSETTLYRDGEEVGNWVIDASTVEKKK
jgi:hypothetical protein